MKDVIFLAVKVNSKRNPYTFEWVEKLFSMLKRNCTYQNIDFYCLTDEPKQAKGFKTIEIKRNPSIKGWWAKINLFNPDLPFERGQRLIFSDLDNLIVNNIDEAINFPTNFATAPSTAPNFKPKGVITCYSSAFMVWNHGEKSEIYTEYDKSVPKFLRGDQDWIAHVLGQNELTLPREWFQRLSGCRKSGVKKETKVVFCVKPKNHIAAEEIPWVREMWR